MGGALRPPLPPGVRRGSELALRIVSSIVLVAVALGTAATGGWPFALLWLAAALAILVEWCGMARIEPRMPVLAAGGAGLAGLCWAAWAVPNSFWPAGISLAMAAATALCARGGSGWAWAVAGTLYAGLVAFVPTALRGGPHGLAAIAWIFAVVWASDIAAFFVGRRFGGPKLWPAVSPRKTWSGFLGGLAAASLAGPLAVAVVLGGLDRVPVNVLALLAASALASVASQGGDLFESAMKRRFDAKDSGFIIPGHGGVMDRLDGFVAVLLLAGLVALASRWAG